ncbi:toprim domain-containing protein [Candidatus Nomurabacteria bacterium]|nr:toprim domain-containing protein [Candidatus Nomurabacteria bacterium]
MEFQTITISQYLKEKGMEFVERNGEIVTRCVFNDCDADSRANEAHLYFDAETGQYDCKKCGEQGNIITLARHLGDTLEDVAKEKTQPSKKRKKNGITITDVERCHKALPDRIREYLHDRGITDELISHFKLGWGEFYGSQWITIPIKDIDGNFSFFKLRRDPDQETEDGKYRFYPAGSKATLFGWDMLKGNTDMIVICEGEFDAILLTSLGIPTLTSTAGAGTFKDEWIPHLKNLKNIHICFDKDDAGAKGVEKLVAQLDTHLSKTAIHQITLPDRMTDGKDVTDYITKHNGNPDELLKECSKQVAGRQPIDTSKFKPLTSDDVVRVLGLTIKKDEENKLITFLCALSAYTEQSQFNLSFNAPSSTGKSFIPMEVSTLFPTEDVMKLGDCSPKAFFHEQGEYDKESNTMLVDLSRKILIFLDQPHNSLLERLRSLLSHDQKEMISKITDKNRKGGNQTKTVILRGYPAVIFCSAGLKIDEQESTRFILLSPQTSQEKLRFSIQEKIKKESDYETYRDDLNANPERALLKERIEAIKDEAIDEIRIENPELIEQEFFSKRAKLKPRHQRDIGRLMGLTKIFALLNVWFREREGSTIVATKEDFEEALKLWNKISESQEYNLPPYVYELYKDVIVPAYDEKNAFGLAADPSGITRKEILQKHYEVYGRMVQDWQMRQQIIPMLETAGLISQDPDPDDKRRILITPTDKLTTSTDSEKDIVSDTGDVGTISL